MRCYIQPVAALLLPCFFLLLPHLRHVETPIVSDGKQAGIQQTRNNMVFTHVTGLYITVVIALLHVAVIYHRITQYKRYITPAASHASLHVYQPVLRVIRWTVNGGFADMFLCSSQG